MGAAPQAQDARKDKAVGHGCLQSISCGPTGGSLTLEACDLLYSLAIPNLPIGSYEVGRRYIRS